MPYATQWPRPVVGANGLMALAWHPQWERRPATLAAFFKAAQRPMTGQDWAAWMAVRSVVAALVDNPRRRSVSSSRPRCEGRGCSSTASRAAFVFFGPGTGQLRQPLFLSHVDGVVGTAPVEGVLHPREVLDTLGVDERESCMQGPPMVLDAAWRSRCLCIWRVRCGRWWGVS
ncbi:MAG: hypothetical protein R3E42_09560 [Burkholderiaceae bacterium]